MSDSRLEICVLASGSGGNCSVLRSPTTQTQRGGIMLIDIGIGPRTFGRRLAMLGTDSSIAPRDIAGVCLTHLDSDHFSANWFLTLERFAIPIYCHASVADRVRDRAPTVEIRAFDTNEAFEPLDGVVFRPIACAHDDSGSHAFLIDGHQTRIGYATDLGHVPDALLDSFCRLDVLCIESNYDRQMQLQSERPWFLKQRVMGGKGHLSNDEAFRAIVELFDRCESRGHSLPRHIVLLHRSRECNCPKLLRDVFSRDARIARRLTLGEQFEPTPWLSSGTVAGDQLTLAWG